MDELLQEYIDEFNSGEFESLLSMFGSMENILTFFKKRKVLHLIDPFDDNLSDYQLEILNYLLNVLNDREILKDCIAQLNDIESKDDGYYLVITDKEDLAELFDNSGRNITARDYVKAIFGEDNWDHYSNTTDDVYRDVIEELNPENIERLKQHMLDVLTNWKIEVDDSSPDLFNNYSEEGIFYLTPENVGDVIGDEESFMYLLDNDYLPDVTGDLYSIHSNAYNNAYETEIYNDAMSELETFFDVKSGKWVSKPTSYNPEKLIETYTIKFNPGEVVNSIKKFVADRNNWGYYANNLDYVTNWLNMMNTFMDNGDEPWLDFRMPDYPNSGLVDKYINEIFPDYI
jgi:hypothetical protein